MARRVLYEFYAHVDTDMLLSTPPVNVFDDGVECVDEWPWFGQPGRGTPTFEETLRLHLRQRQLPLRDVDDFVVRFKRRLEAEVHDQGARRDVCDAEILEDILGEVLLACAADSSLR
jgi:hypothetical protein